LQAIDELSARRHGGRRELRLLARCGL